jgi:hypothetical protein
MRGKPGGWMIPDIMEINNPGTVTREVVETARERWSSAVCRRHITPRNLRHKALKVTERLPHESVRERSSA